MQNKLFLILFLLPATVFAQRATTDITGLWKGTLYNDTTRQYYKYEIGISEEKGKLTGFSHTWFILDDKQYYGIKKVKIKQQDGKIIVEDAGLIANNYPVEPAKGVRQLNILVLDATDSVMTLTGPFTTNATKNYRPLTGSILLARKNDYWQSALVPHLQELSLLNELSFVKDDGLLAKSNTIIAGAAPKDITIKNVVTALPKKNVAIPAVSQPATIAKETASESNPEQLAVHKSDTVYAINAPPIQLPKETLPVKATTTAPVQPSVANVSPAVISATATAPKDAVAADVTKRTTMLQQTVSFKSDSLLISLYDNGEVDGDTVSVLMNGEIIMSKERLSTNAVRKTIYIPQNTDTVQLLMYAENLGTIPPNTGLLVVKDGKDLYEIRFSGDLQKNAAIIFKRKKD